MVLHATDPEFDFVPPNLPSKHRYVGPVFWESSAEIPSYLDEPGDPWVLATLSSAPQGTQMQLAEAVLEALSDLDVRVLLTIPSEELRTKIDNIPSNARVEGYVPHSEILKQSVLFIGHSGHGSVMKAIYHGVPMVLVPWGRDQPGVAARAEKLGVAQTVEREELNRESLGRAIREVIDNPSYREQAQLASRRLHSEDSVALACKHIEEFLS